MNDRYNTQIKSIGEMQPSFLPDSLCDHPDTIIATTTTITNNNKLLDSCRPLTTRRPQLPLLLHQQLQEQQQQQRQFQSALNAAYLSISPMLAFNPDSSLYDLTTTNPNIFYQQEPTNDNNITTTVGSPPHLSNELMLSEGFYLDQYTSPDPTCWNQGFEELDLERPEDDLLSGGGGGKLATHHLQGDPTLAALNAGSEERSLLDDLDLDDLPLPDEIDYHGIRMSGLNTPTNNDSQDGLMLGLTSLVSGPMVKQETGRVEVGGGGANAATLHELLVRSRESAVPRAEGEWPGVAGTASVATSAAEVKSEPTGELAQPPVITSPSPLPPSDHLGGLRGRGMMRPRTSTMSSGESLLDGSVVSSFLSSEASQDTKYETRDDSHDEGFDSDLDDSDRYSDADSNSSWDHSHRSRSPNTSTSRPRRKERFFWQYNLQAKGPKGNRMPLATDLTDPHQLDEVTDPVFSPNCQVKGIKHTGKARRGDGNDLTPNPCKLHQIGEELKKLNKVIDELTPVGELPFNVRPKSRKEKNKLASRACRLKKKAQHEANKIKLYGLEQEHRRLMFTLTKTKSLLRHRIDNLHKIEAEAKRESLESQLDGFATQAIKSTRVAGNTIEFVNKVLAKVSTSSRSAPEVEQD